MTIWCYYEDGLGVAQSYKKALEYYQWAASFGYVEAFFTIAVYKQNFLLRKEINLNTKIDFKNEELFEYFF